MNSSSIEIENFKKYEAFKISQYLNYQQYGGFGFHTVSKSPALSIFGGFHYYNFKSTVNVNETVDIDTGIKGKDFFKTIINNHDIAGLYYLVGTLAMLFFGSTTFVSVRAFRLRKKITNAIHTILLRYLILIFIIALSLYLLLIISLLLGMSYSTTEVLSFAAFTLYLSLLLTFFYFCGVLIGLITFFNYKSTLIISLTFWVTAIIIIPEVSKIFLQKNSEILRSNSIINMEKSKKHLDYEKKFYDYASAIRNKKNSRELTLDYIKSHYIATYNSNRDIEEASKINTSKISNNYESICIFFPTTYYYLLSREISGKGFSQYINFFDYVMKLKGSFFKFYINKRYEEKSNKVETFCRIDDQIFYLNANLPNNFKVALGLQILYISFTFFFILLLIQKRFNISSTKVRKIRYKLTPGEINFMYTEATEKEQVVNYLRSEGAEVVSQLNSSQLESTKIIHLLKYYCFLEGACIHDVFEYLERFGVVNPGNIQYIQDTELLNKSFLSLQLAKNCSLYVFDDFFKGLSEDFERRFFHIISRINVIYLSGEMFRTASKKQSGMLSIPATIDVSFR